MSRAERATANRSFPNHPSSHSNEELNGHDDKGRLENKISSYVADGKGEEGDNLWRNWHSRFMLRILQQKWVSLLL